MFYIWYAGMRTEGTLYEDYQASEYFASAYHEGVYDEQMQWWLIYPQERIYEHDGFLVVGSPGVDQIEFGYRQGQQGLWSYEPIGRDFRYLAPSVAEMLEGWASGDIAV